VKPEKKKERVAIYSVIIGASFREIIISGLGTSMGTPSLMTILSGLEQLAATCHNLDVCST